MFTVAPVPLFVYAGQILHAFKLHAGPGDACALSLAVAGSAALPIRLGRNARWASIGNGAGAVLMGACGYWVPEARRLLSRGVADGAGNRRTRTDRARYTTGPPSGGRGGLRPARTARQSVGQVLGDRRLLTFAACAAMFTFANAAMLPLAAGAITRQAGDTASLLIAACVVLPQAIVA